MACQCRHLSGIRICRKHIDPRRSAIGLIWGTFDGHQMVEGGVADRGAVLSRVICSRLEHQHECRSGEVNKAGKRELASWSSDDKIPFPLMSVRVLLDVSRRSIGYIWNYLYSAGGRPGRQTA